MPYSTVPPSPWNNRHATRNRLHAYETSPMYMLSYLAFISQHHWFPVRSWRKSFKRQIALFFLAWHALLSLVYIRDNILHEDVPQPFVISNYVELRTPFTRSSMRNDLNERRRLVILRCEAIERLRYKWNTILTLTLRGNHTFRYRSKDTAMKWNLSMIAFQNSLYFTNR